MKKSKFSRSSFLLISALTFFTAGRSIGATPGHYTGTDSVIDEITRIERQYKQAFITGDSALFLKCYTPDACILAPNVPSLCGERGRLQFYKGARQAGLRDASFISLGLFGETS